MKKVFFILFVVGMSACRHSAKQEYSRLVEKELKSNKKVNELFFGISLGMADKEFYDHCWKMNQKGVFMDGTGSATSVLYPLEKNELKYPAKMTFFPEFTNGKINKMWAKFEYKGWMPWNKQLSSDSLLPDVINLYKKWYPGGNSFITVHDEKKGTAYVKVDGNRQIIIRRFDDVDVKVDYTDLSVPNKQTNKDAF